MDLNFVKRLVDRLYPQDMLPQCLVGLSSHDRGQVEATLANDQVSSDEEIVEFWVTECGIPREAALAAIAFRPKFLVEPLFQLFDPDTLA